MEPGHRRTDHRHRSAQLRRRRGGVQPGRHDARRRGQQRQVLDLWNLSAGKLAAAKPVATLVSPGGPVTSLLTGKNRTAVFSVAFSPDGKTLVTSDTNGSAYLWAGLLRSASLVTNQLLAFIVLSENLVRAAAAAPP